MKNKSKGGFVMDTNINNNNNGNKNNGNNLLDKYKKYRGYIIGVILFLVVSAIYDSYTQQKQDVPQCNDPAVLNQIQHILREHSNWTYYNFGLTPGQDNTTLSSWVERKPLDKQLRKRFCEAAFPNGDIIQYDVQIVTGSNNQTTVTVFPPKSNTQ